MTVHAGSAGSGTLFQPAELRSLRDLAYEDIRDAILSGALPPGRRIKERDVAAQMGISTTPVKEALTASWSRRGSSSPSRRTGTVVADGVAAPAAERRRRLAEAAEQYARTAALLGVAVDDAQAAVTRALRTG